MELLSQCVLNTRMVVWAFFGKKVVEQDDLLPMVHKLLLLTHKWHGATTMVNEYSCILQCWVRCSIVALL